MIKDRLSTDTFPRFKGSAVGLYSGGLDSILAAAIIKRQGIQVHLCQFISPFFGWSMKGHEKETEQNIRNLYGLEVSVIDVWPQFLDMVKDPRFGYGKHMNPCIDCKIFMLKRAAEIMIRKKADFVFTGEVLGQRPMSQRRDTLQLIENESGIEKRLVRPLSARNLPESLPEQEGLLDRRDLLDIQGRSRKRQIALARELGIAGYPAPAGGCLLTDEQYALRLRKLLAIDLQPSLSDIELLSLGRHFLLGGARLIIGRNQGENSRIAVLSSPEDHLLEAVGIAGPLSVIQGPVQPQDLETAARIVARYADHGELKRVDVLIRRGTIPVTTKNVAPATPFSTDSYRLQN